ncbi:hypothetical protein B0O44_103109 [Pedobacter nutrimenti]|uniref:Uncharacterized protein n=1 Tax=Pedobacter nutrimenti TaxID=1241337 RepID=A0A318UE46_9SPHI|nr:hypothetical protein B0O44_103109 [Pedobacter nutrimenti]
MSNLLLHIEAIKIIRRASLYMTLCETQIKKELIETLISTDEGGFL